MAAGLTSRHGQAGGGCSCESRCHPPARADVSRSLDVHPQRTRGCSCSSRCPLAERRTANCEGSQGLSRPRRTWPSSGRAPQANRANGLGRPLGHRSAAYGGFGGCLARCGPSTPAWEAVHLSRGGFGPFFKRRTQRGLVSEGVRPGGMQLACRAVSWLPGLEVSHWAGWRVGAWACPAFGRLTGVFRYSAGRPALITNQLGARRNSVWLTQFTGSPSGGMAMSFRLGELECDSVDAIGGMVHGVLPSSGARPIPRRGGPRAPSGPRSAPALPSAGVRACAGRTSSGPSASRTAGPTPTTPGTTGSSRGSCVRRRRRCTTGGGRPAGRLERPLGGVPRAGRVVTVALGGKRGANKGKSHADAWKDYEDFKEDQSSDGGVTAPGARGATSPANITRITARASPMTGGATAGAAQGTAGGPHGSGHRQMHSRGACCRGSGLAGVAATPPGGCGNTPGLSRP